MLEKKPQEMIPGHYVQVCVRNNHYVLMVEISGEIPVRIGEEVFVKVMDSESNQKSYNITHGYVARKSANRQTYLVHLTSTDMGCRKCSATGISHETEEPCIPCKGKGIFIMPSE